jgi:hypothetical protein
MFKLIAFLFWVLFFVFAFKIVYAHVLEPYLNKEMNGGNSKKTNSRNNKGETTSEH